MLRATSQTGDQISRTADSQEHGKNNIGVEGDEQAITSERKLKDTVVI